MKKIYINPGHSDKDPGAVGYETERLLILVVARYMMEYLLAHFVCQVRMNPGSMLTLTEVCNDANAWGADLFVSVHFNAGAGDGFECYIYSWSRKDLGVAFAKHVVAIGQNLRYPDNAGEPMGVKVRPELFVLKNTNMPAILCEGAFVDNLKDIQDWNDNFELQKLGEAYAKAAAEYLTAEEKAPAEYYVQYHAKIGPLNKTKAENLADALRDAGYDAEITASGG